LTGTIDLKRVDTKQRSCYWHFLILRVPYTTSHLVQQFLAKHGTAQLQQPPYSPDLAPCDFFPFPRLKKVLKGHQFEATQDMKRNSMKTLLYIPKDEFKMFPTVAETLGEVCSCGGELMLKTIRVKPP
jgi:hypothetical protein